ncbi:hypothetical protein F4779DRAFT_601447 [Xylariaceae sp. FL0662B]|nr:hypothetical protein F4779DRAFT_601447 [Xylariaceae sp. FL0662B]
MNRTSVCFIHALCISPILTSASGALVDLIPPKKGSNVWVAKQIAVERDPPPGDPD